MGGYSVHLPQNLGDGAESGDLGSPLLAPIFFRSQLPFLPNDLLKQSKLSNLRPAEAAITILYSIVMLLDTIQGMILVRAVGVKRSSGLPIASS